jgi:hypothetical protein
MLLVLFSDLRLHYGSIEHYYTRPLGCTCVTSHGSCWILDRDAGDRKIRGNNNSAVLCTTTIWKMGEELLFLLLGNTVRTGEYCS